MTADTDRIPMTNNERNAWMYLIVVIATSAFYAINLAPRLADAPAAEVSWVPLMLWTVLGSVILTIVGAVVVAIYTSIKATAAGDDPKAEFTEDEREKLIELRGIRVSHAITGVGFGAALVLAMFDADTFWIGNTLFAFGAIGAVAEVGTKIVTYRRGL